MIRRLTLAPLFIVILSYLLPVLDLFRERWTQPISARISVIFNTQVNTRFAYIVVSDVLLNGGVQFQEVPEDAKRKNRCRESFSREH